MSTENVVPNLEYQRLRKEILAYIAENHRKHPDEFKHGMPGVTRFDIKEYLDNRCVIPSCQRKHTCNLTFIRQVLIDLMQCGAIEQAGAVMHGERLIPVFQLAPAGGS